MDARILFVGVGLTHYYNQVLNRLQSDLGVEIHNVVASNGAGHTGEGVLQTNRGVDFRVVRLREFVVPPYYRSFRGLARSIWSLSPDVVVASADYLTAFAFDPLLHLARWRSGARLIVKSIPFQVPRYQESLAVIAQGPRPPIGRALLALQAASYRAADAHVNYVDEAVDIYGSYGVSAARIFVTGNSPDTDGLFLARERIAAAPPILPPSDHRIIHVGRLVPWKRVDLLIEALARVRCRVPSAELVVVGEGPERPRLEALARNTGQARVVRFVGGVYEPEELGRYLQASAVYVLAGMGGLSINDAMCFGKPVVCSICDGTEKHLVREGHNGAFFEAGNPESLAGAISRILDDPVLRDAMGERSTRIIREEVNIHTVVNGYRRAFQYVLGS
jgi:glycosyltransferase involved in cell wall biosynthesis